MIFNLLRTYRVDLLRYLPKFLANDKDFNATQTALSEEHERLRLLIIDIAKQLFVETATWGLDDWERVYGVQTNKKESLDTRRSRLLMKIKGAQTITLQRMNELLNSVVLTGDAHIIENTMPNQFTVGLDTVAAINEVRRVVETYKPAHLTYLVAHTISSNGRLYSGGAVCMCDNIHILSAVSDKAINSNAQNYIAGAVGVSTKEHYIGGII